MKKFTVINLLAIDWVLDLNPSWKPLIFQPIENNFVITHQQGTIQKAFLLIQNLKNAYKVVVTYTIDVVIYVFLCSLKILAVFQTLMYQLCKGVAFCHGHGVLHR